MNTMADMATGFRYFILSLLTLYTSTLFSQYPTQGYSLDNPTFLDTTVADYDVFLTAEAHWRKENVPRKKKMIAYLASKNSIDVIVVERSYAFGHWVNYFLETGDSQFLKEYLELADFFSTMHGVVYEDEYAFYRWLRQFNLENNISISVIGIDLQSFWDGKPILWSFIKLTDQNPGIQEPLAANIEKAKNLIMQDKLSKSAMLKWRRELESATNNMDITDPDFLNYLHNLSQSVEWSRRGEVNYREREIAGNFKRYIKNGQKVYGQYGLGHIMLEPHYLIRSKPFKAFKPDRFISFTSLLNVDEYYSNKILSVGLVCFDCDADTPENKGEVPGPDLFWPFVSYEDFDRLKEDLLKLPPNTFVDLRNTDEKSKENSQLLLVEFD